MSGLCFVPFCINIITKTYFPTCFSFFALFYFSALFFFALLPHLPPPAEKVTYCLQWWGAQWAPGGWCQLLWEPGEVLIRGTKRHQCVGGRLAPRVSRWAPRRGHRELKPEYCHQVMRKEHCLMQSWAAREWDQYLAKARLWPHTHLNTNKLTKFYPETQSHCSNCPTAVLQFGCGHYDNTSPHHSSEFTQAFFLLNCKQNKPAECRRSKLRKPVLTDNFKILFFPVELILRPQILGNLLFNFNP